MSKLYNEYLKLKKEDNIKLYLFKSGIFYISLEEDAAKLAEMFDFKLTNLNESITKCGFPQNRLEYYTKQLTLQHIPFKVIDSHYEKIDNYDDYLNNVKLKKIIQPILTLDMNNTSFREAFELLNQLQQNLKHIYNAS